MTAFFLCSLKWIQPSTSSIATLGLHTDQWTNVFTTINWEFFNLYWDFRIVWNNFSFSFKLPFEFPWYLYQNLNSASCCTFNAITPSRFFHRERKIIRWTVPWLCIPFSKHPCCDVHSFLLTKRLRSPLLSSKVSASPVPWTQFPASSLKPSKPFPQEITSPQPTRRLKYPHPLHTVLSSLTFPLQFIIKMCDNEA